MSRAVFYIAGYMLNVNNTNLIIHDKYRVLTLDEMSGWDCDDNFYKYLNFFKKINKLLFIKKPI